MKLKTQKIRPLKDLEIEVSVTKSLRMIIGLFLLKLSAKILKDAELKVEMK